MTHIKLSLRGLFDGWKKFVIYVHLHLKGGDDGETYKYQTPRDLVSNNQFRLPLFVTLSHSSNSYFYPKEAILFKFGIITIVFSRVMASVTVHTKRLENRINRFSPYVCFVDKTILFAVFD